MISDLKNQFKAEANLSSIHGGDWNRIIRELGLRDCPPLRIDFSVCLNPLGMPPEVESHLRSGKLPWDRYPEPFGDTTIHELARIHDVPAEQVLVGNGSTDLFALVLRVLKPDKVVWISPCYCGYPEVCQALGIEGAALANAKEENDFAIDLESLALAPKELVFLASPNNPTGSILSRKDVIGLATRNPFSWIILDESYLDFLEGGTSESLMSSEMPANLIVIKSFTKFFALPGLRLGMLCAPKTLLAAFKQGLLPWSVNAAALAVAPMLYRDSDFIERSQRSVRKWRGELEHDLKALKSVEVFPSHANFLYLKLPFSCPAQRLQRALLKSGILIRSYGGSADSENRFCRIAVRFPHENAVLVRSIRGFLE